MLKVLVFVTCISFLRADVYEEFETFPTNVWSDKAPVAFFSKWGKEHDASTAVPPSDDDSIIELIPGESEDTPAHLHSTPFLLNGDNRIDIRYWLRSSAAGGSKLRIQTMSPTGIHETVRTILSTPAYYDSFSEESLTLPPRGDGQRHYSICLQGEREQTAEGGVAIGGIYLTGDTFIEPQQTTQQSSTVQLVTTNMEPSTTVQTEVSGPSSTVDVDETTPLPTTTDLTVELSTHEPSTTSTISTTAPDPDAQIVYNFTTGQNSWAPGHSNGGYWAIRGPEGMAPSEYSSFIQLVRENFYSGVVDLVSPVLKSTASRVYVEIEFWGDGNINEPALLQLFTRPKNGQISATPFFDLSSFINRPNGAWVKLSTSFASVVGTEVQVIMQGVLSQAQTTTIAVSYLKVTGVQEVPWTGSAGTLDNRGWTRGISSGSKWDLIESADDPSSADVPSFPGALLVVKRETARPGYTVVESPVIQPTGALQKIELEFWLRGSSWSSADLTLRRRTTDGTPDPEPFLDARPYGTAEMADWISISGAIPQSQKPYQVILEAAIGTEPTNRIVVAKVWLTTFAEDGTELVKQRIF